MRWGCRFRCRCSGVTVGVGVVGVVGVGSVGVGNVGMGVWLIDGFSAALSNIPALNWSVRLSFQFFFSSLHQRPLTTGLLTRPR